MKSYPHQNHYCQLVPPGRWRIHFLQQSNTEHINHTLGPAPCSVVIQHKLDSIFGGFVLFEVLIFRGVTKMKFSGQEDVGGVGGEGL